LDESNLQWNSSCFAPSLDIERQFSKVSINEGAAEIGYRQNKWGMLFIFIHEKGDVIKG
jgi:hypothetical protein